MIAAAIVFRKKLKEMFKYHGAEHKCINMYENLGQLPDNASTANDFSRVHLRCGTNIFILFLPFIILYSIAQDCFANLLESFAVEYWGLLLIFGIVLEIFQHFQNKRITWIFKPGLIAQKYITTKEPDISHLEVAYLALKSVLDD